MKRGVRDEPDMETLGFYGRPSKRAIKHDGGYGPPPMFTRKELLEGLEKQDNDIAHEGLKFLNQDMATQGKCEYELVLVHHSAGFRVKPSMVGLMFHANFVAKRCGDPNAGTRLFFVECNTNDADDFVPTRYIDLGPVDTDSACRPHSCKGCKKFKRGSPAFHPPLGIKIDHSCKGCDGYGLTYPIFHPPGLNIDDLRL